MEFLGRMSGRERLKRQAVVEEWNEDEGTLIIILRCWTVGGLPLVLQAIVVNMPFFCCSDVTALLLTNVWSILAHNPLTWKGFFLQQQN